MNEKLWKLSDSCISCNFLWGRHATNHMAHNFLYLLLCDNLHADFYLSSSKHVAIIFHAKEVLSHLVKDIYWSGIISWIIQSVFKCQWLPSYSSGAWHSLRLGCVINNVLNKLPKIVFFSFPNFIARFQHKVLSTLEMSTRNNRLKIWKNQCVYTAVPKNRHKKSLLRLLRSSQTVIWDAYCRASCWLVASNRQSLSPFTDIQTLMSRNPSTSQNSLWELFLLEMCQKHDKNFS